MTPPAPPEVEGLIERLLKPDWHDPVCPFPKHCFCGTDDEPPHHDKVMDALHIEAATALTAQAAYIRRLEEEALVVAGNGVCAVGFGGPFEIHGEGHPLHLTWLPKGYGPPLDQYTVCLVAPAPGEDWGDARLKRGYGPPLIEAIRHAIERELRRAASIRSEGS